MTSHRRATGPLWAHARVLRDDASVIEGEVDLFDDEGTVAVVRGVVLRAVRSPKAARHESSRQVFGWRWERLESQRDPARKSYLVVTENPMGEGLTEALRATGRAALAATSASERQEGDADTIVYVAREPSASPDTDVLDDTCELLALVQRLARSSRRRELAIVTRKAHRAGAADVVEGFAQQALWGLGRVALAETTHLGLRLLDTDGDVAALAHALEYVPSDETEIALRADVVWSHRFSSVDLHEATAGWPPLKRSDYGAYRAKSARVGTMEGLHFEYGPRRAPARGEIEVEVRVAALNYKDTLKTLGLLSPRVLARTFFGNELGMECAGVVTRAGDGVSGYGVGDEVIVAVPGAIASHVTAAVSHVMRRPEAWRIEEAASPLCAVLSALYSLRDVGRRQRGERVLIHAATGGSGSRQSRSPRRSARRSTPRRGRRRSAPCWRPWA